MHRRTSIAIAMLATSLFSCTLFMSFDYERGENADAGAGHYGVHGTVDGVEGTFVRLTINGGPPHEVGNGPFTFPDTLEDGSFYAVAATSEGHSCVGGSGRVAGADVDVAVHCSSTNTALSNLTLEGLTLEPAFEPGRLTYQAQYGLVGHLIPFDVKVSATTASASAQVSVLGKSAATKEASGTATLTPAPQPVVLDVTVTAASGAVAHYEIATSSSTVYMKSSRTLSNASFGAQIALDGDTLAAGSPGEVGGSAGINGNQALLGLAASGAVYVFQRTSSTWAQTTYIKASNPRTSAYFGSAVALSGNTLVVGAPGHPSSDTIPADNAGAVYVFERTNGTWAQTTLLRAPNVRAESTFGVSLALSGDTLVVGSPHESSGFASNPADTSAHWAGAAYVFRRVNGTWTFNAYLKAANVRANASFGNSLALATTTLAVGAPDDSNTSDGGVDASLPDSGAVYLFQNGTTWSQTNVLKASNARANTSFGRSIALAESLLLVGSPFESSSATGINGDQNSTTANASGAAYVFERDAGTSWLQTAYVKPSVPRVQGFFGWSVAYNGNVFVVGANREGSRASGVNGDDMGNGAAFSGAAYVYRRAGDSWTQAAYVKPSNTHGFEQFGNSFGLDTNVLVVGAPGEGGAASGINGEQMSTSQAAAGAVYIY